MAKVVIDDHIPFIKGIPEALGFSTSYVKGADIAPADVKDADALIVRTRTHCCRELLEGSAVKFIVTATIGYDHLDTAYLDSAGIEWTNCPGCNASSVAQYVRSSLLLLARAGVLSLDPSCKVGIVGVGHVGTLVADVCRSLGCSVLLCDPPRAARGEQGFVPMSDIEAQCDVVTFHVPLTRDGSCPTFHLGDAAFFARLRRKPVVFNTSRGAVVDNEAWVSALDTGQIRAAVVDTWEHEPDVSRALLQRAFIATPHIAGYSADGKANATRMALTALCRYFGVQPRFKVSPPSLPAGLVPAATAEERALQLYNPMRDSVPLKEHPERFEDMRNHYPLRREKWE